jgi:hypothetical protein
MSKTLDGFSSRKSRGTESAPDIVSEADHFDYFRWMGSELTGLRPLSHL